MIPAALLGVFSPKLKIIFASSAIAFLAGTYSGYKATTVYYQSREALQLRKELINQEIHRREVESLLRKQEELESLVSRLAEEADNDVDARRPAVGRDGVRRINQVR